ncbi:hypothetical protein TELCIR_06785 [Teladorsagia circumcincta]|uniref:Uncharacterized protein n=1 Tax=Teladorsagia circumcincta TaxID=45464 RepID=A0A2G9UMB3_TELCI|nr:hypothetical protein TELCIR_06785 [Teladorsagia circumcincta]
MPEFTANDNNDLANSSSSSASSLGCQLEQIRCSNSFTDALPFKSGSDVARSGPAYYARAGDCETVHLNADVRRTECSLAELRKYASEQSLEDSVTFLKAIREKDATLSDNDLLTIALSYAELFYKLTIRMLKSVPDVQKRFDLIKELVGKVRIFGNSNISRPEEPSTSSSSLEFQLIESELSDGGWLMYGLMSICPSPEVFTDESSPFNQQNFLHCMRYGAHCQKLAFIRCDNVQKKLICDQHCEVVFDQAISPVHTIRVSAASTEVLCVYSVSVVYVPRSGASSDEFPLPLGLKRIVSPGCAIKEARAYFYKYYNTPSQCVCFPWDHIPCSVRPSNEEGFR